MLFRSGGDRNENLGQALESLQIAVVAISRDGSPEPWAAVQVAIAQALLDRTDGDLQAHIENAILALETALDVLPQRASSPPWLLAKRFLGEAYLDRLAGDESENVERCIVALEDAQTVDTVPKDLNAWTVAQANLGVAYTRRLLGDPVQNRTQAVAALEAALAVPFGNERPPQGWGTALATRTLLSMRPHGERLRFNLNHHQQQDGDDDVYAGFKAFSDGQQPLQLDPLWHVPFHLEGYALSFQRPLIRFLNTGTVPIRDAQARERIEIERCHNAFMSVRHLLERRTAGQRTEALFQEIRVQHRPFVLYLRGFNNRAFRFEEGSVMKGSILTEWFPLKRLVSSIAPIPVVWIGNPADSPVESQLDGSSVHDFGFRIESGVEWEQHARALIESASFIVMHNSSMTPGVDAEIRMLCSLGRLGETFFHNADAANQAIGRFDCSPFDSRAIEIITGYTPSQSSTVTLPPAMCPWVSGDRRITMEREAEAVDTLGKYLERVQQPQLIDLTLDVNSYSFGHAVLLERHEALPNLLARQAVLIKSLDFEEAADLATNYQRLSIEVSDAQRGLR